MERPPLGGEGYQRDGASSRFTHLIIFTKLSLLYFKNIFVLSRKKRAIR